MSTNATTPSNRSSSAVCSGVGSSANRWRTQKGTYREKTRLKNVCERGSAGGALSRAEDAASEP
jgi:hypothetical protein